MFSLYFDCFIKNNWVIKNKTSLLDTTIHQFHTNSCPWVKKCGSSIFSFSKSLGGVKSLPDNAKCPVCITWQTSADKQDIWLHGAPITKKKYTLFIYIYNQHYNNTKMIYNRGNFFSKAFSNTCITPCLSGNVILQFLILFPNDFVYC